MAQGDLVNRMIGAATLSVDTFEEVEADQDATGQAAIVVGMKGNPTSWECGCSSDAPAPCPWFLKTIACTTPGTCSAWRIRWRHTPYTVAHRAGDQRCGTSSWPAVSTITS